MAPDLRWRGDGPALDAYDCATGAVPVAGREVCVEAFPGAAAGLNSGVAQATGFGVALRRAAAAATWVHVGHDTPMEPGYALEVVVANTGSHGLRDLAVECVGPGVVFEGGGTSSLPEHVIGPGDLTLHLRSREPRPPPGRDTLTCTVRLTRPAVAPAAPTLTATVDLPR